MRLLIVTQAVNRTDPTLGFFHDWLLEFSRRFESIEVVCLFEGDHALPRNVRVHSLRKELGRKPAFVYAFRFFGNLLKLQGKYDAVFVHMNPEYVVLAGFWWRLQKKRIMLWYAHISSTLSLRVATMLADVIVTPSNGSFLLPTKKLQVVGHGIDTSSFRYTPRTGTELTIITVGRITPAKRVLAMLPVLDELHARKRAFTFTIVGTPAVPSDEEYLASLKNAILARPYASKVDLCGAVDRDTLPTLLTASTVFLHLCLTSSLDKAVLEAAMTGLPVVSASDAFPDLPNGLSIPGGTPEELADAVERAPGTDMNEYAAKTADEHGLTRLVEVLASLLV